MARFPKIRTTVPVPFPAMVKGSAPATIQKANGVWTVGFSFNTLGHQVPLPSQFATDYLLLYDAVNNVYFKSTINDLAGAFGYPSPSWDAAAGDYNVTTELVLYINKAAPAAHNINLPTAASRLGNGIIIKDVAGNAAANIATIVPNGAERIDGKANVKINANFGGYRLAPISGAPGGFADGWTILP